MSDKKYIIPCVRTIVELFQAFPDAIINSSLEFVTDPRPRINTYFCLNGCETHFDIEVKLVEYMSRAAYKTQWYCRETDNRKVWDYHLRGINRFCYTRIDRENIEMIYARLGGGINHQLAKDFVRSGYNMDLLKREEKRCEN